MCTRRKITTLYEILNSAKNLGDREIAEFLKWYVSREYERIVLMPIGNEESDDKQTRRAILIVERDRNTLKCSIRLKKAFSEEQLYRLRTIPRRGFSKVEGEPPQIDDIVHIVEYTPIKNIVLISDLMRRYRAWTHLCHLAIIK